MLFGTHQYLSLLYRLPHKIIIFFSMCLHYLYMLPFCRSFIPRFYSSQSQALSFFTKRSFLVQLAKSSLDCSSLACYNYFFKISIGLKFNVHYKRNWQGWVISFTYIRQNLFIDTGSLNHCETSYMYVEMGWRVGLALYRKCYFTIREWYWNIDCKI